MAPVTTSDTLENLQQDESVSIVTDALTLALEELWSAGVDSSLHPKFDLYTEFSSPYVWWYCQIDRLKARLDELKKENLPYILLFQTYLDKSLGIEYQTVDQLLEGGKMMSKYLQYLYVSHGKPAATNGLGDVG
jgi:hypothetical protein